jgi:LacI family repressor for deo operon, udp, cdd, tsx, nupC, and nupG
MPNLKDIAKRLNLSTMTVSRAINTPDKVSKATREKVYSLIKEMNYKPNIAARSLATDRTGVIVVMTGLEATNIYLMHLIMGITEYLSQNGYSLMLSTRQLKTHCDGVIVMGLSENEKQSFIAGMTYPFVLFGEADGVDCVDIDNFKAVYDATGYLLKKGHERIGYIGFKIAEPFARQRYEGYRRRMSDEGKPVSDAWVYTASTGTRDSYNKARDILALGEVTAFVCINDMTATAVLDAVKDAGLRVPEDISVIGFDGIYEDRICTPQLTTVAQPVFQIGAKLASLMIRRIQSPNAETETVKLELKLKEGSSVKNTTKETDDETL